MKTKPKLKIDLKKVSRFASQGMSQAQIAESLGMAESTLQARIKEQGDIGEIRAAIAKGRASSIELATNRLFAAVKKGKPWAVRFFLERRGGFNERKEVEVSGDQKKPLVTFYIPKNGRDPGT